MKKYISAAVAGVLALAGCAENGSTVYEAPSVGREVWLHPGKSLAVDWQGPEDNGKVTEMVDLAYRYGVEHVLVRGMHLDAPEDVDAVELNKYAHVRGVCLILSYDKYDRWRWGNTAAVGDESRRAEADSCEIILWPCPEGKTYGIVRSCDETEGNLLGRLVTSTREINVMEGDAGQLDGTPAMKFFANSATQWAETRELDIVEGEYAVVARKADGEGKWFVGAINGASPRETVFATDFLNPGHEYAANVYCGRDSVVSNTINGGAQMRLNLPAWGGFGIEFCDLTEKQAPFCVVPQPVTFEIASEGSYRLESGAGIRSESGKFASLPSEFLKFCAGDGIPALSEEGPGITLVHKRGLPHEAYEMDCGADGIVICASDADGAWWALQSLLQIVSECTLDGAADIRYFHIADAPAFPYRGAHLDCVRHFFTVDEVKTYIDLMSMHKLNTLHWHLTDDQGWRLEIKKYPLLTEVGAKREGSQIGQDYWQKDGIPYGPYCYTQEQAREIVAYAASRHITVIPEIEMPGHSQAAIASYPYLACDPDKHLDVRPLWGSTDEGAVCPSKETTYEFFQDVLDEVCDIFPSEYIHIGGDEVDFSNWKKCDGCQRTMQEKGFTKPVQLHGMLVKRIEEYMLRKQHRRIIGWDEILDGGLTKTAVVMSWRGMEGGVKAAKMGNDAVLCPARWCYFDRPQSPYDNVYQLIPEDYRDMLDMRLAYSFNPVAGLSPEEAEHIIGVQSNVWTEYINDFPTVLELFIPRISATAEVGWTPYKTEYEWFDQRVDRALVPLYQARGLNYYKK